jgi:hypothetical protein
MAIVGFQSTLGLGNDNASPTYTDIVELNMVSIPEFETGTVEASYMNQSTKYRDFIPTLTNPGVIEFECNFTTAQHAALYAVHGKKKYTGSLLPQTGNNVMWQIKTPDENGATSNGLTTFVFNGILTKMSCSLGMEEKLVIKGTIQICGSVTIS